MTNFRGGHRSCMSNVGGGLRQRSQSIDEGMPRLLGMSLVARHHRWLDRCSVVAKVALVARAISLASGGLFSNDHSRVDLPLAGAGGHACCQHQPTAISRGLSIARLTEATAHSSCRLCNSHSNAVAAVFLTRASPSKQAVFNISHTSRVPPLKTRVADFAGLARELRPRAFQTPLLSHYAMVITHLPSLAPHCRCFCSQRCFVM